MVCAETESIDSGAGVGDPVPIVLLASQGSEALVELATELDIRGADYRLILKVETESEPARDIAQRLGDTALYVICRGPQLGKAQIDQVQTQLTETGLKRGASFITFAPDALPAPVACRMLLEIACERDPHARTAPRQPPPISSIERLSFGDPEEDIQLPRLGARGRKARGRWVVTTVASVALAVVFNLAFSAFDTDAQAGVDQAELQVAYGESLEEVEDKDALLVLQQELAIAHALETPRFRALDGLLVDTGRSNMIDRAGADAYCAARSHRGLPGWRIPTTAEASKVLRAGLLNDDIYWTSKDEGVFDSLHPAEEAETEGARTFCVRDRHLE